MRLRYPYPSESANNIARVLREGGVICMELNLHEAQHITDARITSLKIDAELLEWLDQFAAEVGVTRSTIIRAVLHGLSRAYAAATHGRRIVRI